MDAPAAPINAASPVPPPSGLPISRRLRVSWRRRMRLLARTGLVRWLLLGVVAGLGSGLLAVLFYSCLEGLKYLLLCKLAGLSLPAPSGEVLFQGVPGPYRPWIVPLALGGVGIVTGLLVGRLIPAALSGVTDGTDATIRAFHRQAGLIRPLVPLLRGATAILTIAAGGSAGQEGPISQLGAGLGSFLGQKLGLTARERRILLLAGAAGGLGAIFRAPLGGAITAVEVLYAEDFEAEALLPAIVSSVVAYTLFTFVFGSEAIIQTPGYRFGNVFELPFYLVLAVVAALAARLFILTFRFFKFRVFGPMRDRYGVTAAMVVGGLAMGLFGLCFPQLLGGGYGFIEQAANARLGPVFLLGLCCGKMLATSLTIGSGLSGGMFAPSLYIGGMAGSLVGQVGHALRPDIVTQPGGYTLVGMAAFFAGVAHAPVGPLIMVCEISQGYGLLAPLMLASAVTMVLCHGVHLYENQVDNKFASPAHAAEATSNILERVPVSAVYTPGRVATLEENVTLRVLADIISGTSALVYPVKNMAGRLTGLLSLQDARCVLFEQGLGDLLVVRELMRPAVTVNPDMSLYDAMLRFIETDLSQLPVVSHEAPDTVLGLLNRQHVFTAYSQTLRALKNEQ